jgi:hypothetical protein
MWERSQRDGKPCVTALRLKAARREAPLSRDRGRRIGDPMFANMPGPTTIDVAGVSALGQALVYHEGEEARRSDKWRDELAQRLEAELTTHDCLARGYVPAARSRRLADRSPARVGRGTSRDCPARHRSRYRNRHCTRCLRSRGRFGDAAEAVPARQGHLPALLTGDATWVSRSHRASIQDTTA